MHTFSIAWKQGGTLHTRMKQAVILPLPDDVLECDDTPLLRVLWRYLPEWNTVPVLYCAIVSDETAEAIAELKGA